MPRPIATFMRTAFVAAILLAAFAGCSDQDPIDTPPPDTKSLWTVRANGGGDFTDLQEGINAAGDGDTVIVGPGRYATIGQRIVGGIPRVYALHIGASTRSNAKSLTIRSEAGPDSTIIGDETIVDFAVVLQNTPGVTIEGFEIRGGGNRGVFLYRADATLTRNRITGSTFAVRAEESEITLRSNHIIENQTGLEANASTITTIENLFDENTSDGIVLISATTATLRGDTIRASGATGIVLALSGATVERALISHSAGPACDLTDSRLSIRESTLVSNGRPAIGAFRDAISVTGVSSVLNAERVIIAYSGGCAVRNRQGAVTLSCCDLWENLGGDGGADCSAPGTNGTFAINPSFCNLDTRDYSLRADSPCASENSGACGLVGAFPVRCE
ncbi:MAG: right-handed parallel beta-helix repeat-containing protein [bacterium]